MKGWLRAVAALLVTSAVAHAQTRIVRYGDDRLSGIDEVDVVVFLTAHGASCTVSRPPIQKDAVEALRAAHIRATLSEKASSWHYTVFVNLHSASAAAGCATAVSTELVAQVEGFPEADKFAAPGAWGSILMGPMSLAQEIDLVTGSSQEHDAAVQHAARTQVTALAERIRRANP